MSVDPATAKAKATHEGKDYFFCAQRCCEKFIADPARSSSPEPAQAAPAPAGTIYIRPMDPEVRQAGPGICRSAAWRWQPDVPAAGAAESRISRHEASVEDRRGAALPGLSAGNGADIIDLHRFLATAGRKLDFNSRLCHARRAVPGFPFFERGVKSLFTRHFNMFTLISLGTGVAYVYSVAATLARKLFPPEFRGMHGAVAVYFEASAVIIVLALLGQALELSARERTGDASGRSWISRRRPRAGFAPMEPTRTSRSSPSPSATGARGRAKRSPSTAR